MLFAVASFNLCAQRGEKSIGLNFGYSEDFIGIKFNYVIVNQLRVSPSLNQFMGNGSGLEVQADLHYLITLAPQIHVYPLAGITYSDAGRSAVNAGIGVEHELTYHLTAGLEVKYNGFITEKGDERWQPSLHLTYKF